MKESMKIHPLHYVFYCIFFSSLGFNILYHQSNQKLIYHIQKLEAGPARGLFLTPEERQQQLLKDQELNELIKKMLRQMIRDRVT